MDKEQRFQIEQTLEEARKILGDEYSRRFEDMDFVEKMMLVALMGEIRKINDSIDCIGERIAEQFCTDFIPWEETQAMPALTLLRPTFKETARTEQVCIGSESEFTMKVTGCKKPLKYLPIFKTTALPYSELIVYTWRQISVDGEVRQRFGSDCIDKNIILLGITTDCEINCMDGVTLMVEGINEKPERIIVGKDVHQQMAFSTMGELEQMSMAYPFDAQQFSNRQIALTKEWRRQMLQDKSFSLLFITDPTNSRDLYKPNPLTKGYTQWLEDEVQNTIKADKTLWVWIEYRKGFEIPEVCDVKLNVFPVVNINVESLDLTQNVPIRSVEDTKGEYFVGLLETSSSDQKKGFAKKEDEVIVRDFDASCYDNAALGRDIRSLYTRFKDDYWAFVDFNGIKDGVKLEQLRKAVAGLQKATEGLESRYKYESGTYLMKNWGKDTTATNVKYVTTNGKIGNAPKRGDKMDNKSLPLLKQAVEVMMDAVGGDDKILGKKTLNDKSKRTLDERREQLRYYTLTDDRLYTKMDIDAFLRKEIMEEFGNGEFKRIFIDIHIEGAGGEHQLHRGLYIDISFKDKKNYQKAEDMAFGVKMKKDIEYRSCIAMPVFVNLVNLENSHNG